MLLSDSLWHDVMDVVMHFLRENQVGIITIAKFALQALLLPRLLPLRECFHQLKALQAPDSTSDDQLIDSLSKCMDHKDELDAVEKAYRSLPPYLKSSFSELPILWRWDEEAKKTKRVKFEGVPSPDSNPLALIKQVDAWRWAIGCQAVKTLFLKPQLYDLVHGVMSRNLSSINVEATRWNILENGTVSQYTRLWSALVLFTCMFCGESGRQSAVRAFFWTQLDDTLKQSLLILSIHKIRLQARFDWIIQTLSQNQEPEKVASEMDTNFPGLAGRFMDESNAHCLLRTKACSLLKTSLQSSAVMDYIQETPGHKAMPRKELEKHLNAFVLQYENISMQLKDRMQRSINEDNAEFEGKEPILADKPAKPLHGQESPATESIAFEEIITNSSHPLDMNASANQEVDASVDGTWTTEYDWLLKLTP